MDVKQIEVVSQYIVDEIVYDMRDRRGLRQEWDNIDSGIQEEIKEGWKYIAIAALNGDMH